jgi:hypothetical protein
LINFIVRFGQILIPGNVDIVIQGTGFSRGCKLDASPQAGQFGIIYDGTSSEATSNTPYFILRNITVFSTQSGIDETGLNVIYDQVKILGNQVRGSVGVKSEPVNNTMECFSTNLAVGYFDTDFIMAKDHCSFGRLTLIKPTTTFMQIGSSSTSHPIDFFVGSTHMEANGSPVVNAFLIENAGTASSIFFGDVYIEMAGAQLTNTFNQVTGATAAYPYLVIGMLWQDGTPTHNNTGSSYNTVRVIVNQSGKGSRFGWVGATPPLPSGTGSSNDETNFSFNKYYIYMTGNAGTHIVDQIGTDMALPVDPPFLILEPFCKIYFATTVPSAWAWFGATI